MILLLLFRGFTQNGTFLGDDADHSMVVSFQRFKRGYLRGSRKSGSFVGILKTFRHKKPGETRADSRTGTFLTSKRKAHLGPLVLLLFMFGPCYRWLFWLW